MPDVDVLEFPDPQSWDAWLVRHHDVTEAWLRIRRKNSDLELITISEALDVALAHGWIDGLRRSFDEKSFLQRYSPRRPTAAWSRLNVERAEALEAAGQLREGGRAQIAAARADGRWAAAYAPQSANDVPPDVTAALQGDPVAAAGFERLNRSQRYSLLLPLMKARTDKARARELARCLEELRNAPGAG